MKGLGDYTIPDNNKFQADGDPKTLGEIYAYGFRNAHGRLGADAIRVIEHQHVMVNVEIEPEPKR